MMNLKYLLGSVVGLGLILVGGSFTSAAIPLTATTNNTAQPAKSTVQSNYHADRVIVKFKSKAMTRQASRFARNNHLQKQKTYEHLSVGVFSASDSKTTLPQLIQQLKNDPSVELVEPDYRRYAFAVPNDTRFVDQWGLHNTQQQGGVLDADIDAPEAWDSAIDASNVVVAVVDSGIDYNHPDLTANMWQNPNEIAGNGIDDDANGYIDDIYGIDTANADSDPMDDNNHGTHIAGIIGAEANNGQGVAGINWNVQLMALKFLDNTGAGFNSGAIELLNYIISMRQAGVNVVVVNHSWGGSGYSQILKDAFIDSAALGVLHAVAAGNSSLDNDDTPTYPANYDVPGLISVAASTVADQMSSFSNYGLTTVDIAAPGSNILSTIINGGYRSMSGTSMATPFVAGSAAQLFAQDPTRTVAQVRSRLMGTSDIIPALSPYLQSGRLNLHQALTCVEGSPQLNVNMQNAYSIEVGQPQLLTAYVNDCGAVAVDMMQVTVTNALGLNYVINLMDDGLGSDILVGDGLYSGIWSPASLGSHDLTFSYSYLGSSGSQLVTGGVVVSAAYLFDDTEPYVWQDISTTGTALNRPLDDAFSTVTLPFSVNYFELPYSTIDISTNGAMSFHNGNILFNNEVLPTTSYTDSIIAPFWDDFNLELGGEIYWQEMGVTPNRQLIIQYEQVLFYSPLDSSNSLSFQVIFNESSDDIIFQYKDVQGAADPGDFAAGATIGLQRDSSYAQQYSFNQPNLRDNMAIRWHLFNAEVAASNSEVDFGSVSLGQSASNDVELINFSAVPYTVATVTQSGTNVAEFVLTRDDCTGMTIAPGGRCLMNMDFVPSSQGVKSSQLIFTPVDVAQPVVSVAYTGLGIITPDIAVQPALTYSNVVIGQSETQSVVITNNGSDVLNISSISIASNVLNIFTTVHSCSAIPVAGECSVDVTFQPVTMTDVIASLVIISDDPDTPLSSVAIQGSAIIAVSIDHVTADFYGGMAPLDVNFSLLAVGGSGSYSYQWNFDDGSSSNLQNPSHQFLYGSYNVTVTVTDANNANNFITSTLPITAISPLLIQSIGADRLAGVAPLAVTFNVTAVGGSSGYSYLWDFGDGTTSSAVSPSHTYNSAGNYNVSVVVTDVADVTSFVTGNLDVLVVAPALSPISINTLGADKLAGVGPLPVLFNLGISGGSGSYNYLWNFGDGDSSPLAAPSHTYTTAGSYTATVTITDQSDASNFAIGSLSILVVDSAAVPLVIQTLGADKLAGVGPLPVQFNLGVTGGSGSYSYSWNFGDGAASAAVAPLHTFTEVGSYSVTVTITDQTDVTNSAAGVLSILVVNGPVSPLVINTLGADQLAGMGPLPVNFNLGLSGGSGSYSYIWNFGDGSSSTLATPSRTYTTAGSYTVTVTIVDQTDASNFAIGSLTVLVVATPVSPVVIQTLSADKIAGVGPLPVQFNLGINGGSGSYSYLWLFGDGSSSTEALPLHTFVASGAYSVSVTITDLTDSSNSAEGHISVLVVDPPVSPLIIQTLGADKLAGVGPLPVQFNLGLTGGSGSYSYLWEFGDGSTSTLPTPLHIFSSVGSHTIKVTITDRTDASNFAIGSLSVLVMDDLVLPLTIKSLGADKLTGVGPLPVQFSLELTGGSGRYDYLWEFGGGRNSTQAAPLHNFVLVGSHTVKVTITDQTDASNFTVGSLNVLVTEEPVSPLVIQVLGADKLAGVGPLSVQFSLSVNGGSGDYSYFWEFGDDSSSVQIAPMHSFTSLGEHTVKVTITDKTDANNVATGSLNILVIDDPVSPLVIQTLGADKLVGVGSLPVQFAIGVGGGSGSYNYLWEFGDGSSSTQAEPRHSFTSVGSYTVKVTITDQTDTSNYAIGSLSALVMDNSVTPLEIQTLSADNLAGVGPLAVQFSLGITGGSGSYSYLWEFGGGRNNTQAEPQHIFTSVGSHTIKVTVTDQTDASQFVVGSLDILVVDSSISPLVIHTLGADKLTGVGPLPVQFSLGFSGGSGSYNYLWEFGDGVSSTEVVPLHNFTALGSHTVKVTISDQTDASNFATSSLNIIVVDNLVSPLVIQTLGADKLAGVGPLAVQFTLGLVGGSGSYSYLWAFGDGSSSTEATPLHSFSTLGNHTVNVTITDQADASNVVSGSLDILVINDPVSPLVIETLGADKLVGMGPLSVQFSLGFTGGSGGYDYLWEFEDGSSTIEAAPLHTFTELGSHTVKVTITDQANASNFAIGSLNVLVLDTAVPPLVIHSLGADRLAGVGPLPVQFMLGLSGGSGRYSYLWEFGDGASSTEATPQHSFTTLGTHAVNVTITDKADASNYAIGSLNILVVDSPVSPLFIQSIGGDQLTGVGPLPVQFNLELAGGSGSYSYLWAFGDGQQSIEALPLHIFTTTGLYVVTVSVTDNTSGAVVVGTLSVLIIDAPDQISVVLSTDQDSNSPASVAVTASMSGGSAPYSISWDFGDGELLDQDAVMTNEVSITHNYRSSGSYVITATVTSTNSAGVGTTAFVGTTAVTNENSDSNGGGGSFDLWMLLGLFLTIFLSFRRKGEWVK